MRAENDRSGDGKRPFEVFVTDKAAALLADVRRVARRVGLPTGLDVEDLVQTAFARLCPRYHGLPDETAAYNYAFATAVNELRNARRAAGLRSAERWLEGVHDRHVRPPVDPEEIVLRRLRRAAVIAALRRLPAHERQAIALVDLEQLNHSVAARHLGVPQTTLKGWVQRGRARMRRDLGSAPGIAVLVRVRRSVLAPIAASPGLALLGALMLTVWHIPALPPPAPFASDIQRVPRFNQPLPRQAPRRQTTMAVRRPMVTPANRAAVPARRLLVEPASRTGTKKAAKQWCVRRPDLCRGTRGGPGVRPTGTGRATCLREPGMGRRL